MPGRRTAWCPATELLDRTGIVDRPAVLLFDESMLGRVADVPKLPLHVVVVAMDAASASALGRRARLSLAEIGEETARQRLINAACQLAWTRLSALRRRHALSRRDDELRELIHVGIGLMAERNRRDLLHKVVEVGKRLTQSDAGALVLVESDENGEEYLRLALYESDSVPDLSSITVKRIPIDDASPVGHAAKSTRVLVVRDVYDLPPNAGFESDPTLDEQYSYRRRSMLLVPMLTQVGRLVGILMLVNRKTDPAARIHTKEDADRFVLPYTDREVRVARALASHAAVSIENAALYERIEALLESFVKAAVTAVDQRDPSTAGHSLRVAALTTALATEVDRADHGALASVHFTREQMRELYFAALLHDFGKVTVSDEILLKAKKLPPTLWERVDARFDLICRTIELDYQRQRARIAASDGKRREMMIKLDRAMATELRQLRRLRQIVRAANEPAVLSSPDHPALFEMATRTYERPDGTLAPYLTQDELHYLRIPQGSLDDRERAEVESHVDETYRFLANIPWTDDLKDLAAYAYGHHEKLNGTGYPRHLHAADIPIQTRLLAIADTFDALTESDRPYKPAMSPEAALDILRAEASAGLLDPNLVQLLIDSRVYRKILDEDWHRF